MCSCLQEAAIDLKLPRRSLLVTFTCDACGARSQRLINKLAYERGLVYVQVILFRLDSVSILFPIELLLLLFAAIIFSYQI